jgi:hypothetical protein
MLIDVIDYRLQLKDNMLFIIINVQLYWIAISNVLPHSFFKI